jgi:hypothetical protein
MYKTIFAFVIGKILLIINYYLFEKLLDSCKINVPIFPYLIVSILLLSCILYKIQDNNNITRKFLEFFTTMCLCNICNFMFFNLFIIFHITKLSCLINNQNDFITLEMIFGGFSFITLIFEIIFFVKTSLEYQKISYVDHMDV